ncbi:MAG TPA: hypothetical protein VNP92_31810 [Actinophytocola sp.]|nr:hypothetical protein [Actinophytocola sp.]
MTSPKCAAHETDAAGTASGQVRGDGGRMTAPRLAEDDADGMAPGREGGTGAGTAARRMAEQGAEVAA